jgi:hypothetical protein
MIRALSLAAALAVGMTSLVSAAEIGSGPASQNLFTEVQARQHLMHLGYTDVSELSKDQDGKWVGVATTKDGQKRVVAVDVKGPASRTAATN